MIDKIKQKFMAIKNWVKEKAKKILAVLGMGSVVLAMGTQTTILNTSPINYPLTADKQEEKLEFLYQAQEELRLQHNEMGRKYREGEITDEEWQRYKKEDFDPKSKWIGWGISVIGEKIGEIILGTTTEATSSGKVVVVQKKMNVHQFYKEVFSKSNTWAINLDNILK